MYKHKTLTAVLDQSLLDGALDPLEGVSRGANIGQHSIFSARYGQL